MSKKFLFIQILDKEIIDLLSSLRNIFNNKEHTSSIHITLKGPQKSFRTVAIRNFLDNKYPIRIYGSGMFDNHSTYVVYLNVECEGITGHIWNKPDFKDEFNPHLTLFKGKNKFIAESIFSFLKDENIDLVCNQGNRTKLSWDFLR